MTTFKYFLPIVSLAFASVAQGQHALPDHRTRVPSEPLTKPGVRWVSPTAVDSLPPWCIIPPKAKPAPAKKRTTTKRRSAKPRTAKTTVVPTARKASVRKAPVKRKAPAKPKAVTLDESPRLMCPQFVSSPRMYGAIIPTTSAIPLFATPEPPADPMAFIDVPEAPGPVISTVEAGPGRKFPVGWLWGGGGLTGVGFFTSLLNGDDPKTPGGDDPTDPPPSGPPDGPPPGPPEPPPPPPVTPTPEPGTLVLLGTGLAALGGAMRRRGKRDDE